MELLINRKGVSHCILYSEQDHELIIKFKWNVQRNKTGIYYARGSEIGNMPNRVYMHRLIMAPLLRDDLIDHANGNGLDNRRTNIRKCNRSQNSFNSKTRHDNFRGIEKSGKRWKARITFEGIRIGMGAYDTKEEAAAVYNKVASKLCPDFVRLNEI